MPSKNRKGCSATVNTSISTEYMVSESRKPGPRGPVDQGGQRGGGGRGGGKGVKRAGRMRLSTDIADR